MLPFQDLTKVIREMKEEMHVSYLSLFLLEEISRHNINIKQLGPRENLVTCLLQEMSKMLKIQELENARQATVISRLKEALINDRKCKLEVLEAGKSV